MTFSASSSLGNNQSCFSQGFGTHWGVMGVGTEGTGVQNIIMEMWFVSGCA